MRIETIDSLKACLRALLDEPALCSEEVFGHGVGFSVPGKVRPLVQSLQARTDAARWSGEGGKWFYVCTKENWALHLRPMLHAVFGHALVLSLHEKHIEQFRPAAFDAPTTIKESP